MSAELGKYKPYPEYKESGVEWLDLLPSDWKTNALKFALSIPMTDGPHETPTFLDEGVPFVSAEAVSSGKINFDKIRGYISEEDNRRFSLKYKPKLHDVYMIKSGATTGVSAIVETDIKFNIWSPLAVMRANSDFSPYYLLNYLRSNIFQEQVQLNWSFGTQQNIGMGTLENIGICCPPIEEQQSIASFLDYETARIDRLIAKQQQLIELLKEKRQAVISHVVTKGLNPDVPMKDSGVEWLGQVPEHWVVSRYKFCTTKVIVGIAEAATHAYTECGVPIVRSTNITEEGIRLDDVLYLTDEFALKNISKRIYKNDVITIRTGNPGISAVVPEELHNSQCFTNLVATPKKTCRSDFLSEYLNSHTGKSYFELLGWGSAQKNISVPILQNIPIAYPSKDEQQEIMLYVTQQRAFFSQLMKKSTLMINSLFERRSALISAAVTGKIDLRNWAPPVTPSDEVA